MKNPENDTGTDRQQAWGGGPDRMFTGVLPSKENGKRGCLPVMAMLPVAGTVNRSGLVEVRGQLRMVGDPGFRSSIDSIECVSFTFTPQISRFIVRSDE